jgi:hypothetical protein
MRRSHMVGYRGSRLRFAMAVYVFSAAHYSTVIVDYLIISISLEIETVVEYPSRCSSLPSCSSPRMLISPSAVCMPERYAMPNLDQVLSSKLGLDVRSNECRAVAMLYVSRNIPLTNIAHPNLLRFRDQQYGAQHLVAVEIIFRK